MPKTRGSNTVANSGGHSRRSGSGFGVGAGSGAGAGAGSSGNEFQEQEMSNRIEDRLNEVRTIPVEVESRTRGGIERVDVTFDPRNPGHAMVSSESGNTYDVDHENGTCTCRHFEHRQVRCRHIEAADIARGRLAEGLGHAGAGVGQAGMSAQEAMASRQQQDISEEERRRALSGEEQDDNYFYSDNPEEFERDMERLRNEPLPYDRVNALNGSNITFGIELEFVDGDSSAIARELHQLGICHYAMRLPYRSERYNYRTPPGKWKLETDMSVCSGDRGGELVSPVLTDTPETWDTIEKVCEVVQRHGGRVNYKTGAHVHMGMDQLDTARQRWRRFFKSIAGNEESLYRIAGGTQGQYRNGGHDYAAPFASNARRGASQRMRIETPSDVNRMAEDIGGSRHSDRYRGINLTNIPDSARPNTVEFRYFNGTLSPAQIQANIKVAAAVMRTAETARTKNDEGFSVTDNQKRRGKMLNDTQDGRDNQHMMKFVDTFFPRKRDKEHIIGVLAKNKWRG